MKPAAVVITLALLLSAISPVIALAVSEGGVDASTYVDGTTFALSAPMAVPSAGPTGLTANVEGGSVRLNWNAAQLAEGEAISGYNVYRGTTSADTKVASTAPDQTTDLDSGLGLTVGITYHYQVAAYNVDGDGARSNEATVTLVGAPDRPTGLTADPGNGQVTLSWSAPTNTGGTPITNYNVYISGINDPVASPSGTTQVVTGLTNGVQYTFSVAAVNGAGSSERSDPASATPSAGVTAPGAPTGLQATSGNGQVTLSWTAPADNGGAGIDNYVVYFYPNGTQAGQSSTTSLTITGLTNGVPYEFQVAAHNSAGMGEKSNRASATPVVQDQPPSAPRTLAASASSGSISLTWQVPSTQGSTPITGYNIYRSETTTRPDTPLASPAGLSYQDTTIENGKRYYYWATALNSNGESVNSNRADAAFVVLPSAPTNLVATGGSGSISLTWGAPASSGGGTLSYSVYRGTSADALSKLADANGLSYTDSSVEAGVTYYYAVTAKNSAGEGERSGTAQASATAGQSTPSVPRDFTGTPANGDVRLTWTAPENNGGSDITQYRIYRGTASNALTYLDATANLVYNDTGTEKGNTYYYAVSAVNQVGEGAKTSVQLVTVPFTSVPSEPISLSAKMSGANVLLTWDVPDDDGGAAVTGYKVYRGTSEATISPIATAYDTTYEDTGRRDGVTYYYKVAALNEAGEGPSTDIISIDVPKNSVVDSPLGLFAIAGLAVVGVGSVLFLLRRSRTGP